VSADFLAAITRSPNDEDARSVYADWLEERGDTAQAESLRIDSALQQKPPCSDIKKLAKRLQTLRSKTPAKWRAAVMRWSTEKDFTPLHLEAARERLEGSPIADVVVEWVESLGPDDDDDPYGIVRVYEKNVAIAGDLNVSASSVAILGNLAVGKQYTDLIEADQSLLAVAGNMHCGAVWELGDFFVKGNLTCEGVIYGSSYSSNRGEILGSVNTRVIIENGHHFVIHGKLKTIALIGDRISVSGAYIEDRNDTDKLDPAIVDDDEGYDEEKLYRRICKERDVLAPLKKVKAGSRGA
jgi:uncharacterized protein (TIGR02996 family)